MNTISKIVIGVTSMMAGIGIGMLIAPQTGVETQSQIKENANTLWKQLLAKAQRRGEEMVDHLDGSANKVRDKYNQAKGYLKAEADHLKNKVEDAIS